MEEEESDNEESDNEDDALDEPSPKRVRSCHRRNTTQQRTSDGEIVYMTPLISPWFASYVANPQQGDEKFEKLFRLRFRCSFDMFQKLLIMVKEHELFARWDHNKHDAFHRPSSPIELLLLGSLRYIGRGWTFDDLEEATGISNETHRQFFHRFIKWGSTDFFKEQVYLPTSEEEWDTHMAEFTQSRVKRLYCINGCNTYCYGTLPPYSMQSPQGSKINRPITYL